MLLHCFTVNLLVGRTLVRVRAQPVLYCNGFLMATERINEIIHIDGSRGEGGGQIVRSSLALSLVTGRPVTIGNIRAGREKPGLMRQHLTAMNAAVGISGAKATGAAVGSRELTFEPGLVRAGEYKFSVGTAGSATLVLQ